MDVLAVIAFVLAAIVLLQPPRFTNLLAWAVIVLSIVPGLAFLRGL